MENLEKGTYNAMFGVAVDLVGIVVTIIGIVVTIISIIQSARKDKHQKSNRPTR